MESNEARDWLGKALFGPGDVDGGTKSIGFAVVFGNFTLLSRSLRSWRGLSCSGRSRARRLVGGYLVVGLASFL